jgi:hypothetical protein
MTKRKKLGALCDPFSSSSLRDEEKGFGPYPLAQSSLYAARFSSLTPPTLNAAILAVGPQAGLVRMLAAAPDGGLWGRAGNFPLTSAPIFKKK